MNQSEKEQYEKDFEFHPIQGNPVILDFAECKTITDVYSLLKYHFGLPNATGENWNALWDFMSDSFYTHIKLTVEIINFHRMPEDLREYCEEGMFRVFRAIHNKYPQVTFKRLS